MEGLTPQTPIVRAMFLLAAESHAHDQLTVGEIGVVLGIIAACCAVILLAGFGYFTFGNGEGSESGEGGH